MALPDRPDPAQLRRRARELQRAARAGEPEAVARVKAQGFDPSTVGLRRAQHTLARELGHASWPALLAAVPASAGGAGKEPRSSWEGADPAVHPPLLQALVEVAADQAGRLGGSDLVSEHLVLVATDPDRPDHVDIWSLDRPWLVNWMTVFRRIGRRRPGPRPATTPTFEEHLGLAGGLTLSRARESVGSAEMLVAGVYCGYGTPLWVDSGGLDPEDVVGCLAVPERPAAHPPHLDPPRAPWGDLIYYPSEEHAVAAELGRRYPPGRGTRWGVNVSTWKPGFHWVFGDDEIPMLDLVRSVLADPSEAVAVPWPEARRREHEERVGKEGSGGPEPTRTMAARPIPPMRPATADAAPGSLAAHCAVAHALMAGFHRGDSEARARVLAAHPLYVGRAPGRLDLANLRLVDAYATVAAESGFDSWAALVAAADTAETGRLRLRWVGTRSGRAFHQAMGLAARRRDPSLRTAHIVLALAQPTATVDAAADALAQLGVTAELIEARLGPAGAPDATASLGSTPTWHALMGWAAGLALGRGAEAVEPSDVLLALAFGLAPGALWAEAGVEPDAVHAALAALGRPVPTIRPSDVWAAPAR